LPNPSDKPARQVAALEQENVNLRRQVAHLERVCSEQQVTMGQLQSQLETMSEQIALLKKALFGRRRERYIPSPDQKLLFASESLGEDGDEEDPPPESDHDVVEPEQTGQRRKRRRRRKRFEFPQCLPVKRIEHPLPPEELACPCGCGDRVVISEHVTRQLELVPSNAYVAEHVRYTYACAKCRSGDQVLTTEKPETAIEKGIFGPTVLAYLADGNRLVVIASNGGASKHPAWYHNLVANPKVGVEVGTEQFYATATVAQEPERTTLFDRMAARSPAFAGYQQKAAPRVIPVIVLTRVP